MVNISLTKDELDAVLTLVYENRDSGNLHKISGMSYLESIKLINKLSNVWNKTLRR